MLNVKRLLSMVLLITLFLTSLSVPVRVSAATNKVKISTTSAVVIEGDYLYLNMKGTKQKVTWKSSNSNIASISKKGKVTTKNTGRVTITAKIGKNKYTCKVVIIPNLDPNYKTDKDRELALAQRNYLENMASDVPDNIKIEKDSNNSTDDAAKSQERINEMLQSGAASSENLDTEIQKAYKEFLKTWVSQSDLKYKYSINTLWDWYENRIILDINFESRFYLENAPDKFNSGEVYTDKNIQYQYLENFEYKGESIRVNLFYFNREDLISAGLIN